MRLERDTKSEENITGRIIDIIAPSAKASAPCWWRRPRVAKR